MSETDDLEQRRQAIIERIKQVFPKNPPYKVKRSLKVTTNKTHYEHRKLAEIFEGKQWEELVEYSDVVYYLSDVDFLRTIHDSAYLYYLPAFLVAVLQKPRALVYYSFPLEKIKQLLSTFPIAQIDALIACFQFHLDDLMEA
jgi:hypothetical protein